MEGNTEATGTTGMPEGAVRFEPSAGSYAEAKQQPPIAVERVQIGVRMEKRMLKVLKATAEMLDMTLGELLEDIVLHSFEGGGASAFFPQTLEKIADIKKIYGMDYDVHASYRFADKNDKAA